MYGVHLRLIGKRVLNFLSVTIKLLLLGVTAEAIRANINCKSPISKGESHFGPKFYVEGDITTNHSSRRRTSLNASLFLVV